MDINHGICMVSGRAWNINMGTEIRFGIHVHRTSDKFWYGMIPAMVIMDGDSDRAERSWHIVECRYFGMWYTANIAGAIGL